MIELLSPLMTGPAVVALIALGCWLLLAGLLMVWRRWQDHRRRQQRLRREDAQARADRQRIQALFDPLTGLHNRHALNRDFARLVARAQRAQGSFDLYCVQIDSSYQPELRSVMDAAAMAVAQRLRPLCRRGDLLARYAEDLFVLARFRAGPDDDPAHLCFTIRDAVSPPLLTADGAVPLTVIVGSAGYCPDYPSPRALVRAALHPPGAAPPQSAQPQPQPQPQRGSLRLVRSDAAAGPATAARQKASAFLPESSPVSTGTPRN